MNTHDDPSAALAAPPAPPPASPPTRRRLVEALFHAAVDLPPAARERLLDARCADRPTLRREVSLLLAHAAPTGEPSTTRDPGPTRAVRTRSLLPAGAPRFDPPDWMRPGTAIGEYTLIRRLGRGGMSTVFLARDARLARRVAIKFLHRGSEAFEDEARVTARCEHPHIVRIYALGAWRGCPFMVLEHASGDTLRQALADRAALDPPGDGPGPWMPEAEVARIMLPVAQAMAAAHREGVVHCDLKPENVVLDERVGPKVLDFGIARLLEAGPAAGAVVGTPPYMSPEQLRGEAVDHRTDLWSAGVMLFEMLTGRRLFAGLTEQIHAFFDPAVPLAALDAADDRLGRLAPAVRACLAPDPDHRMADAGALVAALERHLAEDAPAPPRRARRRVWLAAALASLAVAALLAHQRGRAVDAVRRAEDQARLAAARELDPTRALAVLRQASPGAAALPEWRRLVRRALAGPPARAVLEHPGLVSAAVFLPDGAHVATACGDEAIRIWPADGLGPPRVLPAHWINRLSPTADGRALITAGKDGTARIWPLAGGEPAVFAHPGNVYHAALAPDGARLATAGWDGAARVWPVAGGDPVVLDHGRLPDGSANRVYAVAFRGGRLATVAFDGRLRLWPLDAAEPPAVIEAHPGQPAVTLDVAADGRILTGGFDGVARVWTLDGRPPLALPHPRPVVAARFSPDGARVLTGDLGGGVWLAPLDGRPPRRLGQHDALVHGVDFAPDGRAAVSASIDGSARVWRLDAPAAGPAPEVAAAVLDLAPAPGGGVWSIAGDTLRRWPLDGHGPRATHTRAADRLSALAVRPTDGRIALAGRRGGLRLLDPDGGAPRPLTAGGPWITDVAFAPDGRLAAVDFDGGVRLWAPDAAAPTRLPGHADRALAVTFAPDGARLATGGADLTARIHPLEPSAGAPLTLAGHAGLVQALAFAPDGRALLVGTQAGAWLWTLDGARPRPRVLPGDPGDVRAVAFSPDGRRLAAASADGLRVWPRNGGDPVLIAHGAPLTALAFTDDGHLVAGAADGGLRIVHALDPLRPDSPALWRATTHCPTADARRALLGLDAGRARALRAECLARVAEKKSPPDVEVARRFAHGESRAE